MQSPSGRRLSPERGSARRGAWKAGRLQAPRSRLLRTLEPEARLDPETPSPSKCFVSQKIALLAERAVSGKRAVPDKASVSEKRMVS